MYKYINIYYIYNELFFVLIKKLIKKSKEPPSVLGRSAGFVPCSYLAENGWTK